MTVPTLINEKHNNYKKAQFHTTKGLFYRKDNHLEEALQHFEKSLSLNNHNNPSILHIAEIYLLRSEIKAAYLFLQQKKNDLPAHQKKWRLLFNHCLSNLNSLEGLPLTGLYNDLIEYIGNDNVSFEFIGHLCATLIITMRNLLNTPFTNNKLLLSCLSNGIIPHHELEIILGQERKRILQISLSQLAIRKEDMSLASALAINAYYNEYIVYYDEHEKLLVNELSNIIHELANKQVSVKEISGFLLLYSMYEPINKLKLIDYIENAIDEEWSPVLGNIIQWNIINPLIENDIKVRLKCLEGNQNTEVSALVQQQYEENPYPRWIKIYYSSVPLKYIQTSKSLLNNAKNITFLDSPKLDILIAGCGTGQHPLSLAKEVQAANILAIDISLASLAYAQRMTNEYQVNNIQFMQADILNLASLSKTFHIIESVGVLHHMENPEQGLEVLLQLLKPRGIIKLGLYSTIARKVILQFRQLNNTINMLPTKENIQHFRSALLNNPESEYYLFTGTMDFYSTSSCRDLLFHRQEHTYTIPQLKLLIEKYHLRFLGFQHRHHVLENYKSFYPDDPAALNLDNWHDYEQKYPETFRGMYQFHCQINK